MAEMVETILHHLKADAEVLNLSGCLSLLVKQTEMKGVHSADLFKKNMYWELMEQEGFVPLILFE